MFVYTYYNIKHVGTVCRFVLNVIKFSENSISNSEFFPTEYFIVYQQNWYQKEKCLNIEKRAKMSTYWYHGTKSVNIASNQQAISITQTQILPECL